ncbi:MAG: cytochrome C oxidase subunit IV family protein [Chloroflexi bacterium]|nr:cytochrome C oxidase subunit IV family protein [Chloroflexota bacterium]
MEHVQRAKPNYIRIFVLLAALTAIEVVAALSIATPAVRVLFLLLLALAKAGLVAAYYMHLKFERLPFRVIALGPLILVLLLTTTLLLERNLPR